MVLFRACAIAVAIIGTAAAGAPSAHAQDRGAASAQRWAQMDTCAKDAFTHFPDYTAEGLAQREAYIHKCLRDHNLPPWTSYSPPAQPATR
jgi:hypothetical protein